MWHKSYQITTHSTQARSSIIQPQQIAHHVDELTDSQVISVGMVDRGGNKTAPVTYGQDKRLMKLPDQDWRLPSVHEFDVWVSNKEYYVCRTHRGVFACARKKKRWWNVQFIVCCETNLGVPFWQLQTVRCSLRINYGRPEVFCVRFKKTSHEKYHTFILSLCGNTLCKCPQNIKK